MQYSIVNLNEVKANDWRLDGEYWLPEYLENEKLLKSNGIKIEECLHRESIKNIKNVKGDFDFEYLEISNTNACDYETNLINSKEIPDRATYILKEKDVCISTVRPNLNAVAFIKNHNQKYIVGTSGFCVLRCNDKIALPEFVYIFTKTKLFINALIRENKATMYPAVSDFDIKKTYIPLLSHSFQTKIANLVQKAFELQQSSQTLYKEAETLLLQELGLLNWKPKHQLWYVKNYSETVQANRFDAEYFQPMYEEVLGRIDKINNCKLADLVVNYSTGYPYQSENYVEEGVSLIRISNIKKGKLDLSNVAYLSNEYANISKKDQARKGDILISMSGTIGNSALIEDEIEMCCVNQRILAITTQNIDKQYLMLFLNSIAGELQINRIGAGGVQINISARDVLNLQIPLLPLQTQQQISQKVVESKENDKTSKTLLETAKKAVEMAIEENEELAMKFVNKEVKNLGVKIE